MTVRLMVHRTVETVEDIEEANFINKGRRKTAGSLVLPIKGLQIEDAATTTTISIGMRTNEAVQAHINQAIRILRRHLRRSRNTRLETHEKPQPMPTPVDRRKTSQMQSRTDSRQRIRQIRIKQRTRSSASPSSQNSLQQHQLKAIQKLLRRNLLSRSKRVVHRRLSRRLKPADLIKHPLNGSTNPIRRTADRPSTITARMPTIGDRLMVDIQTIADLIAHDLRLRND